MIKIHGCPVATVQLLRRLLMLIAGLIKPAFGDVNKAIGLIKKNMAD
jgi:hypothetical protein